MGGQMVGWWGCVSCGSKVPNDHRGPCMACGDRIARIVPAEMAAQIDAVPIQYYLPKSTALAPVSTT